INYLVSIDDEGKLRWARNNALIDTTEGKWQVRGEGKGIIPQDSTRTYPPIPPHRNSFGSLSSTSVRSRQEDEATHYAGSQKGRTRLGRAIRRHFTLRGTMDRLLRKTVRKNTWIYVAVRCNNSRCFKLIRGQDKSCESCIMCLTCMHKKRTSSQHVHWNQRY
ncbi:uncharacterized protein EDB91DRAFT_1046566, partial [Suillus paluster]|uniref:uncharacterized protein n=1 Tax=Suillus paluster TaxID=48578 RepID=UPI001B86E95C